LYDDIFSKKDFSVYEKKGLFHSTLQTLVYHNDFQNFNAIFETGETQGNILEQFEVPSSYSVLPTSFATRLMKWAELECPTKISVDNLVSICNENVSSAMRNTIEKFKSSIDKKNFETVIDQAFEINEQIKKLNEAYKTIEKVEKRVTILSAFGAMPLAYEVAKSLWLQPELLTSIIPIGILITYRERIIKLLKEIEIAEYLKERIWPPLIQKLAGVDASTYRVCKVKRELASLGND